MTEDIYIQNIQTDSQKEDDSQINNINQNEVDPSSKIDDYFSNSDEKYNNETNNNESNEIASEILLQNSNKYNNEDESIMSNEIKNHLYSHSVDNRIFNKGQHVRRSHRYIILYYN